MKAAAGVRGAAAVGAIVAGVLALSAAAGAGAGGERTCKPTVVNGVTHYCGPATASLSVFPGVTFRNGACHRQTVGGRSLLSLGIGARSQNAATNNGLRYFGLTVSGPAAHPTGGGVIAFSGGKRWGGRGIVFRGTANGGSFVARGINGSTGTATGRFHC